MPDIALERPAEVNYDVVSATAFESGGSSYYRQALINVWEAYGLAAEYSSAHRPIIEPIRTIIVCYGGNTYLGVVAVFYDGHLIWEQS